MRNVNTFILLYFFWGLLGSAFGFLVPVYLVNRGIGNTEIGLLMGAASLAAFTAGLPSGMLADRLGPRRMVALGFLLEIPFYYLLTLTTNSIALAALFIVFGFAGALGGTAADSALYRLARDAKGALFGLIHASNCGGIIIGLLLSSVVIAQFGFQAHALLLAAAGLAGLLVSQAIPLGGVAIASHPLGAYASEFRKGKFLLFALAMFLLAFHWGTEKTSFPLYASRVLGFGDSTLGIFFALNIAVFAVGGLLAGRFIDVAKGRAPLFITGLLLSAAGSIIYAGSYDFGSALLARSLHDIGDAMIAVMAMFAVSGISAKERLGGAVGAVSLIYVAASATGAVVSGALNDFAGYSFAIVFSAALTLLSAAILFLSLKTRLLEDPFA